MPDWLSRISGRGISSSLSVNHAYIESPTGSNLPLWRRWGLPLNLKLTVIIPVSDRVTWSNCLSVDLWPCPAVQPSKEGLFLRLSTLEVPCERTFWEVMELLPKTRQTSLLPSFRKLLQTEIFKACFLFRPFFIVDGNFAEFYLLASLSVVCFIVSDFFFYLGLYGNLLVFYCVKFYFLAAFSAVVCRKVQYK